ncbi:hypothetical protein PWG71_22525 [Nocardiopsis sp. N85]|uniref:hypothetical protein n=1 Tax=Nocardiopsis sp. N85 TaxID=3029400 RepID=UPI00237F0F49|nr:hypothetical protein [Nocardiopsis sp. N85]MDE3724175.1 hypothetical protein [Nocardiopsis sp. N85]
MKKRTRPLFPALAGAVLVALIGALIAVPFLNRGGDDPEVMVLAYIEAVAADDAEAIRALTGPGTGRADAERALAAEGGGPALEVEGVWSEQLGAMCTVRVDGVRDGVEETWVVRVVAEAQRWPVRVLLGRDQRWYLDLPEEASAGPRPEEPDSDARSWTSGMCGS